MCIHPWKVNPVAKVVFFLLNQDFRDVALSYHFPVNAVSTLRIDFVIVTYLVVL